MYGRALTLSSDITRSNKQRSPASEPKRQIRIVKSETITIGETWASSGELNGRRDPWKIGGNHSFTIAPWLIGSCTARLGSASQGLDPASCSMAL